jgi:hypothetical protein
MAMPAPPRRPAVRSTPPSAQVVLQYVGFQDTASHREYVLIAQMGDAVREYTVSIGREAFVMRKALLQDGPDICYRKLMHELSLDGAGTARLRVSDDDLARYRESHAPPARRPHPRRTELGDFAKPDETTEPASARVI